MKYIWKDVYMAGVMGILVPGLLLNVGVMASEEAAQNQIVTEAVVMETEKQSIATLMANSQISSVLMSSF